MAGGDSASSLQRQSFLTRQPTAPTRALCAGPGEAPREREELSLRDRGGKGQKPVKGAGTQALGRGDNRQINTRIHLGANIQGGTSTTWKEIRQTGSATQKIPSESNPIEARRGGRVGLA